MKKNSLSLSKISTVILYLRISRIAKKQDGVISPAARMVRSPTVMRREKPHRQSFMQNSAFRPITPGMFSEVCSPMLKRNDEELSVIESDSDRNASNEAPA